MHLLLCLLFRSIEKFCMFDILKNDCTYFFRWQPWLFFFFLEIYATPEIFSISYRAGWTINVILWTIKNKNSKNKANTKKYIKKWERKSGVICNFTTNKIVAFELWRQRVLPDVSMVHSRKSDFSIKLTETIFNFGKTKQILVLSENKLHFVKLLSLANSDSGIKSDESVNF